MPHHLWLFLLGSVAITLVPGADMALVTRQVLTRGRSVAQTTITGNISGLVVHAAALAAGLSALLVASATAYTAVKLAGAAYLVYLGLQSLRQAQARRTTREARPARPPRAARRSAYLQGLISTVLNPKPALFFLSYLPRLLARLGGRVEELGGPEVADRVAVAMEDVQHRALRSLCRLAVVVAVVRVVRRRQQAQPPPAAGAGELEDVCHGRLRDHREV